MSWADKQQYPEFDSATIFAQRVNLDRATTSKDLSTGALSFTTSISAKWRIKAVLVHASEALADCTITVTFDSLDGANYDTVLGKVDFDNTQDVALESGGGMKEMEGEDGDEIKVTSSGGTAVGTVYVTVLYELLA